MGRAGISGPAFLLAFRVEMVIFIAKSAENGSPQK